MLLLGACTTDRSGQAMDGPRRPDAPPIPLPPDSAPGTADGPRDGGAGASGDGAARPDGAPRPDAAPRPDSGPRPDGQPGSVDGGAMDRFLLRGRVVTPTQVLAPGEVLVVGKNIQCVAASCAADPMAQGATSIDTGGVIFPGLVDAHNHTQYNYIPTWHSPGAVLYMNRNQWADVQSYKDWTASVNANEAMFVCEQVKYGEIRALIGGTTTIQGTFNSNRVCFRTLVHNAEYGNELGPDKMRTNIGGIASVNATDAASIVSMMMSGAINAYVLHLAEGIDETSRREFDQLVQKGMLQRATVIIHGTALGAAEFAQIGAAGAKLVWSPLSNLVLYGRTTDIPAALAAGVPVSLAPDWTLSGSPSLLHELRVARDTSMAWPTPLSAQKLVEMVTITPARALALDTVIGSLEPGKLADVLVVTDRGGDAYQSLVDSRLEDVRLVMVAGDLRYGDASLMRASPRTMCEAMSVCGASKSICIPDPSTSATDHLGETLADITAAISSFYPMPLRFDVCGE